MTYQELCKSLASRYPEREAKAVIRYLLEVGYGLSMADIISGAAESIPADEMGENLRRLQNYIPVQYVVGKAEFGGRIFKVTSDVLIPRPETYELCQWIKEESQHNPPCTQRENNLHILDIGTGSGCIATTLALDIPHAQVEAWDISGRALNIARQNAESLNAHVNFRQADALNESPEDSSLITHHSSFNIIVSNPPYICRKEAAEMERHVLDHEPHEALFVPDEDPLLFYKAIGQYASIALANHGLLFFEINPLYANDITKMLDEMGYSEIETRKDLFGKTRFVRARKKP